VSAQGGPEDFDSTRGPRLQAIPQALGHTSVEHRRAAQGQDPDRAGGLLEAEHVAGKPHRGDRRVVDHVARGRHGPHEQDVARETMLGGEQDELEEEEPAQGGHAAA
jgi:hypothetical protein